METILSFYDSSHVLSNWIYILTGIILSYIGHLIFKKLLGVIVTKIVIRSKNNWDDILIEAGVLERISLLVPMVIIHSFLPYFPGNTEIYQRIFTSGSIVIIILTMGALLTGVNQIYKSFSISEKHPIKSYIQIIKLVLYVIGGLASVSILMGKSPMVLVSGLGAMTAILLL